MSRFLDERLQSLCAYTPGEQPQDKKYIKLNTNESPFPPSPKVIEAISAAEVADLRLYSDPSTKVLTAEIAKRFGVLPENIYTSNGSDDILNFTCMAFCGAKKGVAFPEISYGFYEVYAELYNLDCKKIPLNADFSINPSDYFGLGRTILIANPNAPTGMALPKSAIEEIVKNNPNDVVLVDEAYVDFGAESSVELVKKYKNVIVCHTMSKSRSLAGARLGYAIADAGLIEDLNKIKFSTNPYAINRLSSIAGIESMRDEEYFQNNCKKIIKIREKTINELEKLGFFTLPSCANFIFTKKIGVSGQLIYEKLREHGILVRHFTKPEICDYMRITIGSQSEMDSLVCELEKILGEVQ